jgi:3-oxoacyl-[acyl-carrier protein] reductase
MTDNFASLKDRVVIVTGAGRGIGCAYAKGFARNGAVAVIAEVNADNAKKVETEIAGAGGRALAIPTDITDAQSVQAMVDRAASAFGRIDGLVNNAAFFADIDMKPFYDMADADWDKAMRTNITGAYLCSKAVVPHMRARQWGRIVHISSTVVQTGRANYLHYVTSKAALVGMTRGMARELGDFGITVNAVMPGLTRTELPRKTTNEESYRITKAGQAIKRTETPEDLVGVVLFLVSDAAGFVTGQTLPVDGGGVFR